MVSPKSAAALSDWPLRNRRGTTQADYGNIAGVQGRVFGAGMRKSKRKKLVLQLILLAVMLTGTGVALLANRVYHSVYFQPERYCPPPPLQFRAARMIYPYSVVPGGVFSSKELSNTMQVDAVARTHYEDVRLENLIAIRTREPMQAFVSYRIGDKILWTRKKVRIPPGELLLTDGRSLIRTRCGNRLVERLPRSEVLSTMNDLDSSQELMFEAPLPSIAQLPPALQPVLTPGVTMRDLWKKGSPPAEEYTPEPATMVLFASGLLLMFRGRSR